MPATSGYKGALETNDSQISFGVESVWGQPTGQFQAIRYVSSTLAGARQTQRPTEISGTREASQMVTTQITAGGTINFAMSDSTFDEIVWANVLQNDWSAAQTINGASGDITLTASSGVVTLSSTTPGKFATIQTGQWIRILGFTNTANNSWWYVLSGGGNSPDNISLDGPNVGTAVTETPSGSAAKVRGRTIRNGKICKTYFVEQALDTAIIMQYPGAYASRATLTGGTGAFLSGTVDLVAKTEQKVTATSSTGAILAAPTGRIIDPIGGFVGAFWNGDNLGTIVENFAITIENTGAASEFAMGSTAAGGILSGTHQASGTMRCYFKDFTLFQNVIDETTGVLSFIIKDSTGVSYAFTFLDAKLDGRIAVGGPGQAVSVDFTISGGPTSGGTFVIDHMAAS